MTHDLTTVTESTCGEACWQAREDVCRCSCGGRNHGCDRDGTRPGRTCQRTIRNPWGRGTQRNTYILSAIIQTCGRSGFEYRDEERAALEAAERDAETALGLEPVAWRRSDDPDLPAFIRTASASQRKWVEVAPFDGTHDFDAPLLVWKRIA